MRRLVLLLLLAVATSINLHAQEKKVLRATLAEDKDAKPTTSFAPDVAKIYAFYIGDGIKTGDKLKAVWVAEDVGTAAPKGTKIDEATLTADRDNPRDAFSLSKPAKGWPLGKYKVDLYCNDALAQTLTFTISEEADEPAPPDEDEMEKG